MDTYDVIVVRIHGGPWTVDGSNQTSPSLRNIRQDEDQDLDALYVRLAALVADAVGADHRSIHVRMLAYESPI